MYFIIFFYIYKNKSKSVDNNISVPKTLKNDIFEKRSITKDINEKIEIMEK